MKGGALKSKGILALAALLLATGCGSSGNDEVTVRTGSLAKAAFIEKADAICKAAHVELVAKYTRFLAANKSVVYGSDKGKQIVLLGEAVDSVVAPSIEGQIKRISQLGAPSAFAPEVAAYLNTLDEQLTEVHEDPTGLTASIYPFKKAEGIAHQAGISGCAESFS
jgi:hypothetical protein